MLVIIYILYIYGEHLMHLLNYICIQIENLFYSVLT